MPARPLLLGHRGARREAPENTLEAFDLCLRHGCDGFEFDVRLTADAQPVICHDPKLGRREIATSRYQDLQAPCLEDVLAGFMSRAFLDIELKVPGLEGAIVDLLRRYPPRRGYYVSSFLPEVVEALYRLDHTLKLGLICSSRTQCAGWTSLALRALFLERSLCSAAVVSALHTASKEVFVWTVNRENEMRAFGDLGVDGIISDDTALLVKTFSRHESGDRKSYQES
jgi:glycerophosphoryl diester phosphodiesterase